MWLSSAHLALALALTGSLATCSPIARRQNPTPNEFRGVLIAQDAQVDWDGATQNGLAWALVEATRGTTANPNFGTWYQKAQATPNFMRGAYHIAEPNSAGDDGAAQAQAFVQASSGSSGNKTRVRRAPGDGSEFPGTLRIGLDSQAGQAKCFGLDPHAMTAWISAFVNEYKNLTGQAHLAINMNAGWWGECTGDATDFSHDNILFYRSFGQEPNGGLGGWMQAPAIGNGQVDHGGDLYLWDQGFNIDIHAWAKGQIAAPPGGEF